MSGIILGSCGSLDGQHGQCTDSERVKRLEKINAALIGRAERMMDREANAYSLFQAAIVLQQQVHQRTEELVAAKRGLEKSNREMLEAKEAAEIANRSKSSFLTAAGHDLLQPLNAARLLLSALSEASLSADGQHLVGQVDRALASIEDLIKSVLDISKLDAGVMVANKGAVRVRDVLASVAGEFAPMASQKGLRISVRAPDVTLLSDPVLLKRIISNLVSNAVRYTPEGGVLLGARRRADKIRLDVIDTGVGIPASWHESIFEEFQRGPAASQDGPGGEGLGLGLSIVRRMCDTLGHSLAFRSVAGRGSRFSLDVPLLDGASAPPLVELPRAPRAYGIAGARLLLVENDRLVVDAMRALVARWQSTLRFAQDIPTALTLLEQEDFVPDLIVADYHLDHGLCGPQVVERVRAVAGRPIPAIITTADYSPQVEAEVARQGLALLKKPLKPAELRALIAHHLL